MPEYVRRTVTAVHPRVLCPMLEEGALLPAGLTDEQRLCLTQGRLAKDFPVDMLLKKRAIPKTYRMDLLIKKLGLTKTHTMDIILVARVTKTFTVDILLKKAIGKTFTADILLHKLDIPAAYGMGIKIIV